MKNYFYLLLLAVGLIACNKENANTLTPTKKGNTFVGITLSFPETPKQRSLPDDYNKKGEWEGRDKIESFTVFLVNETMGTIDYTSFTKADFNEINAQKQLTPKKAIKGTSGERVKAYVVINDINDKVTSTLKGKSAAAFDNAFQAEVEAIATDVSKMDGNNEVVMMTNDIAPTAITVEPNIDESTAILGPKNHIEVSVSRVVSRGIVTMATGLKDKKITVKNINNENASEITIKEIKYSIGASNKKFYVRAQKTAQAVGSENREAWQTPNPVYAFVPEDATAWKNGLGNLDFTQVATRSDLKEIENTDLATVKGALTSETNSKFVLPLTHADANYRKGNTTYFEVRCTFIPNEVDGKAYDGKPKTVFLGTNDGKFYSTRDLAIAEGQGATQYKDGVMKYVLWLNPDKPYNGTEKITKSPVVRNQIYHAHISSFNSIGVPSNPLNPGPNPDPNNPKDPDDPNDPENPKNPIDPNDPLQVNDTYISASIQVLQWGIHSYTVGLGSDIY